MNTNKWSRNIRKFGRLYDIKRQQGMTLLEIIIVLGIIGTISAGVVVLAQRAFDSRVVSEVVQNTNTVRITLKDAYQRVGNYPDPDKSKVLKLTAETIRDPANNVTIARLVQIGKLSVDEARNSISNDYFNVGGAKTSATATSNKGFFIEINGLNMEQCRSIIEQIGNNWDYVEVNSDSAPAGEYSQNDVVDMTEVTNVTAGTVSASGILRSLAADGAKDITPDIVAMVCSDSANNGVILASR